jgi:hypothetical protein
MNMGLPRVPIGKGNCPGCGRPGGFPHIKNCPEIGKK